jgi:hypothetical protein
MLTMCYPVFESATFAVQELITGIVEKKVYACNLFPTCWY